MTKQPLSQEASVAVHKRNDELEQQIAALRAENARLFNLLDFKDPDIDPAATMTPDEMRELQASFDAFVAARQERAAKLADYDRVKEQLTALLAERYELRDLLAQRSRNSSMPWLQKLNEMEGRALAAEAQVASLHAEQAQWQQKVTGEIADAIQKRGRLAGSGEPLFFDRNNLERVILAALTAQQETPK